MQLKPYFERIRSCLNRKLKGIRSHRRDNSFRIRRVLTKSPHIAGEQDINGWTLLHVAVMNEFMYFVDYITNINRSTVNVRGTGFQTCSQFVNHTYAHFSTVEGATPLHIACLYGNLNMIEHLLKSGADWTITDDSGWTPEHYMLTGPGENYAPIFKRMCEEEDTKRNAIIKSPGGKWKEIGDAPDGSNAPTDTAIGNGESKTDEPKQIPSRGKQYIKVKIFMY